MQLLYIDEEKGVVLKKLWEILIMAFDKATTPERTVQKSFQRFHSGDKSFERIEAPEIY